MKKLLFFFSVIILALSSQAQSYNDVLAFDAKGEIISIDYRSKSGLPTPLLFFQNNGSLEKVYCQQAISDSTMFKTEMPIADIVRDDLDRLLSINFKPQAPNKFTLDLTWKNDVAKIFQYHLIYDTKYIRTLDENGLVSDLSLFVIFDGSNNNWSYGGKLHFSDYKFDKKGNWIKRTAVMIDENGKDGDSYLEERIISYR